MFDQFLASCVKEFEFLVVDFGFEFIEYTVAGYECDVIYRKLPNVALTVSCDAGSTPGVSVTLRKGPGSKGQKYFDVALRRLAKTRVKGWAKKSIRGPTDEQMTEVLRDNANLLREYFPEILDAKNGIGRVVLNLLGRK